MRHKNGNKKLGKPTDQRIALLRSISKALVEFESIKTTLTRSKEVKKYVEKLITLGKKGDVFCRREAIKKLPNKESVNKIFTDIAKRYENRSGGYTQIIKIGNRKGDGAEMAILKLVEK